MRLIDRITGLLGTLRGRLGVQHVDNVAPGLWEGNTFRVYAEFNANDVFRFTADTPFALDAQSLLVLEGEARLEVVTAGTPGGSWTAVPTHFNKKLAGATLAPTFLVDRGGTHTGGNQREVLLVKAGTGGQAVAVQTLSQGKRILPAGTYYMRVTVTGATRGMYAIEYDKLPLTTP